MLNPILFTENVIGDFLRYQLATYTFADANLYAQMRRLYNLDETRPTPLLKGPYISLSRAFRKGPPVEQLAGDGIFHPNLQNRGPHAAVCGHQDAAFRCLKHAVSTLAEDRLGPLATTTAAGPRSSSHWSSAPGSSARRLDASATDGFL